MVTALGFASVLLAGSAYARHRTSEHRTWIIVGVLAVVAATGGGLYASAHWLGEDSVATTAARVGAAAVVGVLAAALAGVSFNRIAAFGLPAAAFLLFVWSVPDGRPTFFSAALFFAFLASYAVHLALLTAPAAPMRRSTVWTLGIWFALAVALLEMAWRALRLRIFSPLALSMTRDGLDYQNSEAFLVTSIANLLLFTGACVVLTLGGLAWRRLLAPRFVVFTFSFTASMILFPLLLAGLPWTFVAVYALAMALGMEGRILAAGPSFSRFAARTSPWCAAAVVLLSGWHPVRERLDQQSRLAALPAPVRASPNVLLIVLDTMRRDRMGIHGYWRDTTPNLDRWAKRGVAYENALANSSWTLPSHASMFTGRWCHEHGAAFLDPLDDKYPTLAEALAEEGYETAGFVANLWYCGRASGLARGFLAYNDRFRFHELLETDSLVSRMFLNSQILSPPAERITNDFLEWHENRDPDRPYFAFLNYFDPHSPYHVQDESWDVFTELPEEERLRIRGQWILEHPRFTPDDPVEAQLAVDTYDAAVRYMDFHVGRLLDALERRGDLRNTLVIVTSDHGEHFGERGLYLHGTSLYRPAIDVPLIVLPPEGRGRPERPAECVGLQDLPRTVLEFLGSGRAERFPGRSLLDLWDDDGGRKPLAPRPVISQLGKSVRLEGRLNTQGDVFSVVAGGLQYICYAASNFEEVFDFPNDRLNEYDRIGDADVQETVEHLCDVLDHLLRGETDEEESIVLGADPAPRSGALGGAFLSPRLGLLGAYASPFSPSSPDREVRRVE